MRLHRTAAEWKRTEYFAMFDAVRLEQSKPDQTALESLMREMLEDIAVLYAMIEWQPIDTALNFDWARHGNAILGFGVHTHSPDDAQRGVKAGDTWQAIILWDIYRENPQWVFAKDGKPTWSAPTHWRYLPAGPIASNDERSRIVNLPSEAECVFTGPVVSSNPNVWLGVTAEDQQRANERIPCLVKTLAALRFVSCEVASNDERNCVIEQLKKDMGK